MTATVATLSASELGGTRSVAPAASGSCGAAPGSDGTSTCDGSGCRRANHFASAMATTIAHKVASTDGIQIAAGFAQPAATRTPRTPVGSSAKCVVLIARNRHIASVAVPLRGLSLSSSSMALMPRGVAALARPNELAAKFRIMADIAGWSPGMSGKRRTITGRRPRATRRISPPASAILTSPSQKAITPIRPIAIPAASRAPSNDADVVSVILPL